MMRTKDEAWELRASTPFIIESADDIAEVFISGVKKRTYRPTKQRIEIKQSTKPEETDYSWPLKNVGAFKSRTYAAALEKTRVNVGAHDKRLKSKSYVWNYLSAQEQENLRGSGVKKPLFIYDSKTKLKNSKPKQLIWDTDHKTYIWDIEKNNVQSKNLASDKSNTRIRPEDWIARSRRNIDPPGKQKYDYTGTKAKILIWDPKRLTYVWEEEFIKEQSKKKVISDKTKAKYKVTPSLTIPRPGSKCNPRPITRNAPTKKLVPRSVLTPGHTTRKPVFPKTTNKSSFTPKPPSRNSQTRKPTMRNTITSKPPTKNPITLQGTSRNSQNQKITKRDPISLKLLIKEPMASRTTMRNCHISESITENPVVVRKKIYNSVYSKPVSQKSPIQTAIKNSPYKPIAKPVPNTKIFLRNLIMRTEPRNTLTLKTTPKPSPYLKPVMRNPVKSATRTSNNSNTVPRYSNNSKYTTCPKSDSKNSTFPKSDFKNSTNTKSDLKNSKNLKLDSKYSAYPKSDSKNISSKPEMKTIPKPDLSTFSESKPEKTFPKPKKESSYIYKFEKKLSFNTFNILKGILLARKISKPKGLASRDKLQGRGYIQKNFKAEEKIVNKVRKSCRMSPRISSVQKPVLSQRKSRFIITATKSAVKTGPKVQPKPSPQPLPKMIEPPQSIPILRIPPVPKIKPIPKITPTVKPNPVTKPAPIVKPKVIKPIPKISPIPLIKPIQKLPYSIRLFPNFPTSNPNEDKQPNSGIFGNKS